MFKLKLREMQGNVYTFSLTISKHNRNNIEKLFGFTLSSLSILSESKTVRQAFFRVGMCWMSIVHNPQDIIEMRITKAEMRTIHIFLNSEFLDKYCSVIGFSDYEFIRTLRQSFNEFR